MPEKIYTVGLQVRGQRLFYAILILAVLAFILTLLATVYTYQAGIENFAKSQIWVTVLMSVVAVMAMIWMFLEFDLASLLNDRTNLVVLE